MIAQAWGTSKSPFFFFSFADLRDFFFFFWNGTLENRNGKERGKTSSFSAFDQYFHNKISADNNNLVNIWPIIPIFQNIETDILPQCYNFIMWQNIVMVSINGRYVMVSAIILSHGWPSNVNTQYNKGSWVIYTKTDIEKRSWEISTRQTSKWPKKWRTGNFRVF